MHKRYFFLASASLLEFLFGFPQLQRFESTVYHLTPFFSEWVGSFNCIRKYDYNLVLSHSGRAFFVNIAIIL